MVKSVAPDMGGFPSSVLAGPDMGGFPVAGAAYPGPDMGGWGVLPTWNYTDRDTSININDNGTVAYRAGASGNDKNIRGIKGRNSGKLYFEIQLVGSILLATEAAYGVADSTVSLATVSVAVAGNYVVYRSNNGQVFQGATFVVSLAALAQGDTVGVFVDFLASTVTFNKNGGALSAVVWTFGGGSTLYPFAMFENPSNNNSNTYAKLKTASDDLLFAPPSGAAYSAWGT